MSATDPWGQMLSLLESEPERCVNERDRCPACLGSSWRLLVDLPYDHPRMARFRAHPSASGYLFLQPLMKRFPYRVVECLACGLVWQPFTLSEEFERRYYHSAPEREYEEGARTWKWKAGWRKFDYYARTVERASSIFALLGRRLPEEIEVLDFGAGWGEFASSVRALGHQVTAAELSPQKRKRLESLGVACVELPCEQSFDFIHADQVFEHLANPTSVLQMLNDHLRDGGFIMLRVPTIRRRGLAGALRQGGLREILKIYPFLHVNMFSGKALGEVGNRAGLRPVRARALLSRRLGRYAPGGVQGLRMRAGKQARRLAGRLLPGSERLFDGIGIFERTGAL